MFVLIWLAGPFLLAAVLASPRDARNHLLAEVRRRTEAVTSDEFAAPVEQLLVELAASGRRAK